MCGGRCQWRERNEGECLGEVEGWKAARLGRQVGRRGIGSVEFRFKEGKKIRTYRYYLLTFRLETFMFSPDHCNFACYLVFKFEDDHVLSHDGPIFETDYKLSGNFINITITLKKPNEESGSSKHNYMDWEKSCGEKRDDGWLEARLTKPLLKRHLENVKELRLGLFRIKGRSLIWIIVEGIEFRPVVADNNGWMISSG
ncbi:hypothetical protein Tco_1192744 [Tanacetum coccineum]